MVRYQIRNSSLSSWIIVFVAVTTFLSSVPPGQAEPGAFPAKVMPFALDSGLLDNPTSNPVPVFAKTVDCGSDVHWVRLFFKEVSLPGMSFVRVTSLFDGHSQTLDAESMANWGNGTAFFNGPAVTVELIAGPTTTGNSLRIERVLVSDSDDAGETSTSSEICGLVDDRLPSSDPRVGRLLSGDVRPAGPDLEGTVFGSCTGFIIDARAALDDKLHLSAGHCFRSIGGFPDNQDFVLQFEVPPSEPNCVYVHPAPSEQFRVDPTSIRIDLAEQGIDDYAVFKCIPNSGNPPDTTFRHSDFFAFPLTAPPPPPGLGEQGHALRVTGYGVDGNEGSTGPGFCACNGSVGRWNAIQQTAVGLRAVDFPAPATVSLALEVDICSGNSGGPVIFGQDNASVYNGNVFGILTGNGFDCGLGGNPNGGLPVTNPELTESICELLDPPGTVVADVQRTLSITTPAEADPPYTIALRVADAEWGCLSKFVQADLSLGDTPVYQTQAVWGAVLDVQDPDIVPDAMYMVQTYRNGSPAEILDWSPAEVLGCARMWPLADVIPTGLVDIDDVIYLLAAFSDPDPCVNFPGSNLFPCGDDCPPGSNNKVDIDDILAVLAAFSGPVDPCPAPCSGLQATSATMEIAAAIPIPIIDPPWIGLFADFGTIAPGGTVTIDAFVGQITDLGAYQVAVQVTAGTSGTLSPTGQTIDVARSDFVFYLMSHVSAIDEGRLRSAAALYGGGTALSGSTYIATFTFQASSDADGMFTVAVRPADSLLRDSNGDPIIYVTYDASVTVQSP